MIYKKDLVSVFITTRNRSDLLLRAVKSVVFQTYNNIELIIVDDNSDKSSEKYVKEIIQKYNSGCNMRYLYNRQRQGACNSRNLALNACNGKYITGLDDDDYFLNNRIEQFLYYFDEKYSFICSPMRIVVNNFISIINSKRMEITLNDILLRNYVGNQIFTIASRYKSINGYDVQLPSKQDHDMWIRLIASYGPALRAGLPSIYVDKSHSKRITNKHNKITGYNIWYNKHKAIMNSKHHEAFRITVALYSGNITFKHLLHCKYFYNMIRIVKFLFFKHFPNKSRALYN